MCHTEPFCLPSSDGQVAAVLLDGGSGRRRTTTWMGSEALALGRQLGCIGQSRQFRVGTKEPWPSTAGATHAE